MITVAELILRLQKMPQGAVVKKVSWVVSVRKVHGEGMPIYHDADKPEFKAVGDYPNTRDVNVVVL